MIKLILSGGLGNQMFQYAAARALSLLLKTDLSADLYMFNKKSQTTPRNYELDLFDLQLPVIDSLKNKLLIKSFRRIVSFQIGRPILEMINVFNESEGIQAYDNKFETLTNGATLYGYFQNEKYFRKYSTQIRHDFTFKNSLKKQNIQLAQQINNTNSVSIHIRRGDYLNDNSNLPALDINYYKQAIRLIENRVENPFYFIFSDDMDWVQQNLDIHNPSHVYIDWNKDKDSYIDMQLISLCKHNIIANSSFSWWGAWLNAHSDKVVIAPSVWYKNRYETAYPEGFIPKDWVVI